MGTSVSGKSCFALILATFSGLSSLPQCLRKDLSGTDDGSICGALAPVSLQALTYMKESH